MDDQSGIRSLINSGVEHKACVDRKAAVAVIKTLPVERHNISAKNRPDAASISEVDLPASVNECAAWVNRARSRSRSVVTSATDTVADDFDPCIRGCIKAANIGGVSIDRVD